MSVYFKPAHHRFTAAIHAALRAWRRPTFNIPELFDDLQLLRRQGFHHADLSFVRKQVLLQQLLLEAIEELAASQPLEAAILRRRFVEGDIILKTATELNISQDQLNRAQRQAVQDMSAILADRERAWRARLAAEAQPGLPRGLGDMFLDGEGQLARWQAWATGTGPPWALTLCGLGGSGKSALAARLAQRLLPGFHFDHILWLGAELEGNSVFNCLAQHLLPRPLPPPRQIRENLQALFQQARYLVIIDSLLPALDSDWLDLAALLNPSRLVWLSRQRPRPQPGLQVGHLLPWGLTAAEQFAHQVAAVAGTDGLEEQIKADSRALYQLVGGHPGALALAVGKLAALPMPAVVDLFASGQDDEVAAYYDHVFGSCWPALSPAARRLARWLARQRQNDLRFEDLRENGELAEDDLNQSVQELLRHCLLERTPETGYRLPRLVATFALSEYSAEQQ